MKRTKIKITTSRNSFSSSRLSNHMNQKDFRTASTCELVICFLYIKHNQLNDHREVRCPRDIIAPERDCIHYEKKGKNLVSGKKQLLAS